MPCDIGDNILEELVCRAISLTGHEITPDDLNVCHELKNKYSNFKVQRQKVYMLNSNKQGSSRAKISETLSIKIF